MEINAAVDEGAKSSTDDLVERTHWNDVFRTLLLYEDFMAMNLRRKQDHLNRLPSAYADRLPQISFDRLGIISNNVIQNQKFFENIIRFQEYNFTSRENTTLPDKYHGKKIPYSEMHRNNAVLHSVAREWSSDGSEERNTTFVPLLEQLKTYLPITDVLHPPKVLNPGSGVGRLPLEIAAAGYCSQGNEFSVFMAITGHFILNGIYKQHAYTIYPWMDRDCNLVQALDSCRKVSVPDVVAADLIHVVPELSEYDFPRFSMTAGDFTDIYKDDEFVNFWDGLVTCFFIDTAPVVIKYIEIIAQILKPGGIWVNMGPLLYHWSKEEEADGDERYDQSIEVCIYCIYCINHIFDAK
jgi:carnosine N-methyltransferase